MEKTNNFKWIFAIIVVTVSIVLYNFNKQINSLKLTLESTENRMDSLKSSINDKSQELEKFQYEVRKYYKLTSNEKVVLSSYNDKNKTAIVDVSFDLNNYKVNDVVKIKALNSKDDSSTWNATRDSSGKFISKLALPINENYILNINTDGDTYQSDIFANFFLEQDLVSRFTFDLTSRRSTDAGRIYSSFYNNIDGNEKLKIKEMSFTVLTTSGEILSNTNLMPFIKVIKDGEGLTYTDPRPSFKYAEYAEGMTETELTTFPIKDKMEVDTILQVTDNYGIKYEKKTRIAFDEPRPELDDWSYGGYDLFQYYYKNYRDIPQPVTAISYDFIHIVD